MASTEQRTGFRFGWGSKGDSDKSASQAAKGPTATDSNGGTADSAAEATTPTVAAADAQTDPADRRYGDSMSPEAPSMSAGDGPAEQAQPASSAPEAWPVSDILETTPPAPAPAEPRATGFLADLMRAMQSAADQNRKQVTDRFREEGQALIDSVRSRSGEDLNELRRAADADVASIREWSKSEIARIKAETDERISTRKDELDRQVNEHATLIDREVARVEARIAGFEQQMDDFFARLQNVGDPTTFAAVAQEMPEPPSVDAVGAQARAEALAESSIGGSSPAASSTFRMTGQSFGAVRSSLGSTAAEEGGRRTASEAAVDDRTQSASQWTMPRPERDWQTGESAAPAAESWPTSAQPTYAVASDEPFGSPTVAPDDQSATSAAGTADSFGSASEASSWGAESARPAWQETIPGPDRPWQPATGAATSASETTPADTDVATDATERPSLVYGAPAPVVADALSSSAGDETGPERGPGDRTAGSWPSSFEADARLAALGIDGPHGASFSTETLEEHAAPAAGSDPWSTPSADTAPASSSDQFEMPGEAFGAEAASSESPAARLAGLVPSSELPANGRTAENAGPVPTQVVVTGLMSVASIASFKRHLSRIPGVQGVGVSSGPDGEFIFKTTHDPAVALADVIPTLPGFGAEVVNAAEGTINVAAHDPESDA